jgi:hypothetical protein
VWVSSTRHHKTGNLFGLVPLNGNYASTRRHL